MKISIEVTHTEAQDLLHSTRNVLEWSNPVHRALTAALINAGYGFGVYSSDGKDKIEQPALIREEGERLRESDQKEVAAKEAGPGVKAVESDESPDRPAWARPPT